MDSWDRPNQSSLRDAAPSSPSLSRTTIQRHPSLQGQSETQIPFVSSTEPHDTQPPSPDVASNEPALWQLGRHSYYAPNTGYNQQSTSLGGDPAIGFTEKNGHGRGGPEMNKVDEAGLRDVEEELHRGLQARQVRMQLVL